MPSINELINAHSWSLLSWRERYGSGTWVALAPGPVSFLMNLETIKNGGDIESLELGSYLHDKGQWLPVVFADSFEHAIKRLEEKVIAVPTALFEVWSNAVYSAYERIDEVDDSSYGLSIAVDNQDKYLLVPEELKKYADSIDELKNIE